LRLHCEPMVSNPYEHQRPLIQLNLHACSGQRDLEDELRIPSFAPTWLIHWIARYPSLGPVGCVHCTHHAQKNPLPSGPGLL
jgi:hypothetical protein